LNAEISDISGDVVTIKTDVGTIKTTLDEIQDSINGVGATASTTLYVTSVLSAIAAVIGIIILWFLKKK